MTISNRKVSLSLGLLSIFVLTRLPGQSEGPLQQKMDRYLHTVKQEGGAPGFSVVIVKDGRLWWQKGYGVEVAGQIRPMTPYSVSAAGSLTKSLTALAMMQLVERGLVSLDDPVTCYLPWFRTANKDRSDRITVRMLLNNTSGLREGPAFITGDLTDQAVEQLVRSFRSTYLTREPGTSYTYSNAGFSTAGLIIHVVSGMSYATYLEEKIFRPLGMSHTSTDPLRLPSLNTLYGHHFGVDQGIPAAREPESGEHIPAGSLLRTTAHDLGRYLMFLLNCSAVNGNPVLAPENLPRLWAPEIAFPGLEIDQGGSGEMFHYGLGWITATINGREMVFHGGSTGTMSSWMLFDPERKVGAAILLNLDYSFIDRYRRHSHFTILANLLQLINGEPMTNYGVPSGQDPTQNDYELPAEQCVGYTGRYRITDAGRAFVYRGADLEIMQDTQGRLRGRIIRDGKLLQEFLLDFVNPRRAVSRNLAKPGTLTFRSDEQGRIQEGFYFGMRFVRQKEDDHAFFQVVRSPDGDLRFHLPVPWQVEWPEKGQTPEPGQVRWGESCTFAISSAADPTCVMEGGWFPATTKSSDYLRQQYPGHEILAQGPVQSEVIGPYLWVRQSIATRREGRNWQLSVSRTTVGKQSLFLVLAVPEGQLTRQTQALLLPVLQSLSLNL